MSTDAKRKNYAMIDLILGIFIILNLLRILFVAKFANETVILWSVIIVVATLPSIVVDTLTLLKKTFNPVISIIFCSLGVAGYGYLVVSTTILTFSFNVKNPIIFLLGFFLDILFAFFLVMFVFKLIYLIFLIKDFNND